MKIKRDLTKQLAAVVKEKKAATKALAGLPEGEDSKEGAQDLVAEIEALGARYKALEAQHGRVFHVVDPATECLTPDGTCVVRGTPSDVVAAPGEAVDPARAAAWLDGGQAVKVKPRKRSKKPSKGKEG